MEGGSNPSVTSTRINFYHHSLPVQQRETREDFPLLTEGFGTVTTIGTQQQEHESIFPPTRPFSRVLRDPEPEIQRYINEIDNVGFFHDFPPSKLKRLSASG